MEGRSEGPSFSESEPRGRKKGAKGHINPCQCRPNYLSPCANKRCPGQPVGGGGGGGGEGVVCEVREGCQRCCSLTPITLPLISPPRPPSSLLLRHRHRALVTIHRAARVGRRMRELLKRSHVFISEPCDISSATPLFLFPFRALVCAPPIKPGGEDLGGICKFMCEYALVLCRVRVSCLCVYE